MLIKEKNIIKYFKMNKKILIKNLKFLSLFKILILKNSMYTQKISYRKVFSLRTKQKNS